METGLTEGSNAVYTCNSGYQRIGERIRTCMSNGMWSGRAPNCLRMMDAFILCYRVLSCIETHVAKLCVQHLGVVNGQDDTIPT